VIKSKDNQRRVVVTGLGVVSSLGIGWEEFWKNLIAGKSGISRIESFDTSELESPYAGQIKFFPVERFIKKNDLKKYGKTTQLAIAAVKLAIKDANLHLSKKEANNVGLSVGTTMGESQVLEVLNKVRVSEGYEKIDKLLIPQYSAEIIPQNLSKYFNLKSNSMIFGNACAAGNYAVGNCFDQIKSGRFDIMIAGGVDSFSRLNVIGFNRMFAVANEKCQPFDKNRRGMLVGEGAGFLILESLEHALKRKAKVYAEVLGYALSCDGHDMTSPSEEGIRKCINKLLKYTGLNQNDIDYISAHGTGTETNDKAEASAIKSIFYHNGRRVPVSSIKSMLGHTMGAGSALEAIACCLVINRGMIPPTINFETKDPSCDIDCVPNNAIPFGGATVINNSFAFGGNNCCLLIKDI
jgi:3-oxoacyl-[acyl-carrier-protein] synthase II